MNFKYIYIKNLKILNKNLVLAEISCTRNIKKYFISNELFIHYDQDISEVDESILTIPVISTLITIAWAVGADIYVDSLDKTYLQSLREVKDHFMKFHPQFSFLTNINVKKIVPNIFHNNGTAVLFSGGIDSLASVTRHKDKLPQLISVYGADIPYYEEKFWKKVKTKINNFADQQKLNKPFFIETNMRSIPNERLLTLEFKIRGGWWGGASHGLMLLGSIAPLTRSSNIGTIIIASSETKKVKKPWGSHPLTDTVYKWSDIQIIHDGYELSRFEKTKYIVKNYKKMPFLRVCYSQFFENNCGYCEKCMRTIFDLALAGADPRECNFNINKNIFKYIKNCFIKGRLHWSEGIRGFWEDSQEHIPENFEMFDSSCSPEFQNELKEFCMWFKDFDLSKYSMNTNKNFWDKHFSWRLYYFIYHGKILSTFKRITMDAIKFKIVHNIGIGAYIKKVLNPLNIKNTIQQIK